MEPPFTRGPVLWRLAGVHSVTEKVVTTVEGEEPVTMFWKRMIASELPNRLDWKMRRDVTSYRSEIHFYKRLAHYIAGASVDAKDRPFIPFCKYFYEEYHEDQIFLSKFLLIIEDLSNRGFVQRHVHLSDSDSECVLDSVATFHSVFHSVKDYPDFQRGTYWTLDKRPKEEMDTLIQDWKRLCEKFSVVDERYNSPEIAELGHRLIRFTPWIQKQMEIFFSRPETLTFIHGDLKSANLFFNSKGNECKESENRVAFVDFQWSGRGQCMSDVMYTLLGTNNKNFGASQRQIRFVKYYVDALNSKGVIKYPLEVAIRDFYLTTLDYSRIALSYFFKVSTPESITGCSKDPGELSHTGSLEHMTDYLLFLDYLFSMLEKEGDFIIHPQNQ